MRTHANKMYAKPYIRIGRGTSDAVIGIAIPQTNELNISTNGSRCIRTGYKKDKTSHAIRQDSIHNEQRTVTDRQRNCLPLNIPVFWDVTLCKCVQTPRKNV